MKKFLNISTFAVSLFMILLLVMCLISLLTGFVPYLSESANAGGLQHMSESQKTVDRQIEAQFNHLEKLADELNGMESNQAVVAHLKEYIGSEQFGDLQYVCGDKTYSESGVPLHKGPAFGIPTGSQKAISRVEYYPLGETRCVALYLPVLGSESIDGIISIIPADQLLDLDALRRPPTEVLAVVNSNGESVAASVATDFQLNVGPDFLEFFKTFAQSKTSADQVKAMLKSPMELARQVNVGALQYTVATAPLSSADGGVYLVEISPSRQLTTHQRSYLQQTILIAVLAMFTLICSAVYLVISRKKTKIVEVPVEAPVVLRAPAGGLSVDPNVRPVAGSGEKALAHSCRNPEQFIRECTQLIARSGKQKRFLFCAEIKEFDQVEKRLGVDHANNALFHVEKVLSSMGKDGEYFCYGGGGCFYICGRCNDDEDLRVRCQLLLDLARQFKGRFKMGMRIGVYPIGTQNAASVKEMMQNAALAKNMVRENTTAPYVLYSRELVEEHQNNAKIEQQMEDALRTGEFKLFLQPKYSVKNDCIDSAEALVRWFDPRKNDYIFPAKFLPLFESNGFVVKLDHFMYMEVLQYYEAAAEKGEKAYPICVNVSRVTALQPDFFNFYVSKKKMHNIPDDMLTLEFAESFMSENMDLMKKLIPQFNDSGIRISVDNFTSGGASVGILKKLPVNEINIDRSFLFNGLDPERDLSLQRCLVNTAKEFGIRVVQSGVENKDLFDRCCGLGCDLIQGYYFARAISLEEYRIFIRTNTSIRYKAFVK